MNQEILQILQEHLQTNGYTIDQMKTLNGNNFLIIERNNLATCAIYLIKDTIELIKFTGFQEKPRYFPLTDPDSIHNLLQAIAQEFNHTIHHHYNQDFHKIEYHP